MLTQPFQADADGADGDGDVDARRVQGASIGRGRCLTMIGKPAIGAQTEPAPRQPANQASHTVT